MACFVFQFEQVVVFIPSAVSPVRVSLAGSGCVKAVRFADGGVVVATVSVSVKGKVLLDVFDVGV